MAERRTITVHAFDDTRVHLAPAYLGRLKQGRLKTLCGRLAVTQLSPFAAAMAKPADRCAVCFGLVDADGMITAGATAAEKRAPKAKPQPEAEVIDIAEARQSKKARAAGPPTAAEPAPSPTTPEAKRARAKTTRASAKPKPTGPKPTEKKPVRKKPGGKQSAPKAKPKAKPRKA